MGITPEVDIDSVNLSQSPNDEEDGDVCERSEETARSDGKKEGEEEGPAQMIDVNKMVDKLRADRETGIEEVWEIIKQVTNYCQREMTENEKFAHFKAAESAESDSAIPDDQTYVLTHCSR